MDEGRLPLSLHALPVDFLVCLAPKQKSDQGFCSQKPSAGGSFLEPGTSNVGFSDPLGKPRKIRFMSCYPSLGLDQCSWDFLTFKPPRRSKYPILEVSGSSIGGFWFQKPYSEWSLEPESSKTGPKVLGPSGLDMSQGFIVCSYALLVE